MRQWSASAALIASSTACRLSTGSAPGRPRQTGQTFVFGSAPNSTGQPQNIFVFVPSWTWTSRPMTGSYLVKMFSAPAMADIFRLYGVTESLGAAREKIAS
jgi:hypothetical protein